MITRQFRCDHHAFASGLAILAMTACASAAAAERVFSVPSFSGITIGIAAEVEVTSGKSPSVRVQADSKVLDALSVDVHDHQLRMTTQRGYNTRQPVRVFIVATGISRMTLESAADVTLIRPVASRLDIASQGAGNLVISGIQVEELTLKLAGSESVKVDGKATRTRFDLDGSAVIDARALQSRQSIIRIKGAAEAAVNVSDSLSASIDGAGTIRYKGNPRVSRDIQGAGDLIKE